MLIDGLQKGTTNPGVPANSASLSPPMAACARMRLAPTPRVACLYGHRWQRQSDTNRCRGARGAPWWRSG